MKDEWAEYLKSVGFQDPLLQRADSVLRFYSDFACIDIDLIFVSEYRDSQEGRVYESLWVFSQDCAGEARLVRKQENFDLARLSNNVTRSHMCHQRPAAGASRCSNHEAPAVYQNGQVPKLWVADNGLDAGANPMSLNKNFCVDRQPRIAQPRHQG